MGFGNLPPIETIDVYLDAALKKARENARKHTLADYEKSKENREKTLTLIKIDTLSQNLQRKFQTIIDEYPNFDNLTTFYEELIRNTLDYDELKQSLGAINWFLKQLRVITKEATTKTKFVEADVNSYYGRVSSLLKQIKPQLTYLHKAREILRTFPAIKDGMYTVAIAGFPNVGKSTLLSQLTPAKPEINDYAFTTKTLNLGYSQQDGIKVQYVDTPGTLNREKMNPVERQAHIALRYATNLIIYIFDLSGEGYHLDDQYALYDRMKEYDVPILIYFSKTDIMDIDRIDAFIQERSITKHPYSEREELFADVAKKARDHHKLL